MEVARYHLFRLYGRIWINIRIRIPGTVVFYIIHKKLDYSYMYVPSSVNFIRIEGRMVLMEELLCWWNRNKLHCDFDLCWIVVLSCLCWQTGHRADGANSLTLLDLLFGFAVDQDVLTSHYCYVCKYSNSVFGWLIYNFVIYSPGAIIGLERKIKHCHCSGFSFVWPGSISRT